MAHPPEVCPLPYPDRYEAAASYFNESGGKTLSDEVRLVLYALRQQSTHGAVSRAAGKVPEAVAPSIFSVVDRAKYSAWSSLGDMAPMEAMRLFVRTMEEAVPNWWSLHNAGPANGGSGAPAGENGEATADDVEEEDVEWEQLESPRRASDAESQGRKECFAPVPRYEHSMVCYGTSIVAFAGNNGGRYLSDTHVFNIKERTWERLELEAKEYADMVRQDVVDIDQDAVLDEFLEPEENGGEGRGMASRSVPCLPCAGQAACVYGDYIVVVGGHFNINQSTSADTASRVSVGDLSPSRTDAARDHDPILVRVIDVRHRKMINMQTTAAPDDDDGEERAGEESRNVVPINRGGHSCCIIRDTLILFGGETHRNRRLLSDCHALDLLTMQWSRIRPTVDAPSPRTCHTAVSVYDRYMLIFGGGGSLSQVFSDCYVLDMDSQRWRVASLRGEKDSDGETPAPRAGHGSSLIGREWFIAGGGNNYGGLLDTICIDIGGLRPQAADGTPSASCSSGSDHEDGEAVVDSFTWRKVAQVLNTSPVASEGLCIVTVDPGAGNGDGVAHDRPFLLTFGGYNGRYNNAVSILRPRLRADNTDLDVHDGATPSGGRRIMDLPLREELLQQQQKRELLQIKHFEDENARRKRSQIQTTEQNRGGFGFGAKTRDGRVDRKIVAILQNKLKDMAGKCKVLESQLNLANKRLVRMDKLEKENARLKRLLGEGGGQNVSQARSALRRTASDGSRRHSSRGENDDEDDNSDEEDGATYSSSSANDEIEDLGDVDAPAPQSSSRFWGFLS